MTESTPTSGAVGSRTHAPHESILQEAQRLIHGQRNADYGHPRENFQHSADLFSAYLGVPVSSMDIANLMILMKLSRVHGTGYHRDSYTDIAGYAGCVERIEEEDPSTSPPVPAAQQAAEEAALEGYRPPRVWTSLQDGIPVGTEVIDQDGDYFRVERGGVQFRLSSSSTYGTLHPPKDSYDNFGPFTEVRP